MRFIDIILLAAILAAAAAIIIYLRRRKRKGCDLCGSCEGCPMAESCHEKKKNN